MVEYRFDARPSAHDVARVFDSSGIRRPTGDLARIERMFEHANLVLSAWDGERLVGVCRALTDFSYCCYVSDLAVERERQRDGIGREMLRRLRERLGGEVMVLLLSAPEAMEYYPRVGFERADNAFKIPRAR